MQTPCASSGNADQIKNKKYNIFKKYFVHAVETLSTLPDNHPANLEHDDHVQISIDRDTEAFHTCLSFAYVLVLWICTCTLNMRLYFGYMHLHFD